MPDGSLRDVARSFLVLRLADWATIRLIVLECGVSEGEARQAIADARADALSPRREGQRVKHASGKRPATPRRP